MRILAIGDQAPAVTAIVGAKPAGPADSGKHQSPPSMRATTLALPCAAYEVDPLETTRCGATLHIVDDAGVIDRILKHLSVRGPQPETPLARQPRSAPARRRDH
jgi:hypothetical protein